MKSILRKRFNFRQIFIFLLTVAVLANTRIITKSFNKLNSENLKADYPDIAELVVADFSHQLNITDSIGFIGSNTHNDIGSLYAIQYALAPNILVDIRQNPTFILRNNSNNDINPSHYSIQNQSDQGWSLLKKDNQ